MNRKVSAEIKKILESKYGKGNVKVGVRKLYMRGHKWYGNEVEVFVYKTTDDEEVVEKYVEDFLTKKYPHYNYDDKVMAHTSEEEYKYIPEDNGWKNARIRGYRWH